MYPLVVLSVVTASYAAICPPNNGMNDTIRQKFLDVHNELRALVASGKAKDGLGGYAPAAAAMPKLKYDCEVEKYAIAHAGKCKYEHSTREARGYTGENIYAQIPVFLDKVEVAEDASRSWFNELIEFGVGTNLILDDALWSRGVGHYTQMVWQSTTAIGCAVQECGSTMSFVVCNYNPPGNWDYGQLYETGPSCSKCRGGCSNHLCVDKNSTEEAEPTTVATTTPKVPITTTTVPVPSKTPEPAVTKPTITTERTPEVPVTTTTTVTGPSEMPKPAVTPAPTNSKNKKKKNKKNKKQRNKKKSKKNNKKKN